jgi:uncharacterized protein
MIARILVLFAFLFAAPAMAVDFPPLTGRVVDDAHLLSPDQVQQLTQRLEALQRASSRQLVVATVSSLQDLPIEDYGYQLGRAWGIGARGANNGIILLVAPTERKVRIEVGYGLEGIVTDALSSQIINQQILPHFRSNDYPGGIMAGADALIQQLQAPPEAAEQATLAAQQAETQRQATAHQRHRGTSIGPLIIWGCIFLFIILPSLGAGLGGRRYRGGRHGVSVWGPGYGRGGGSGLGWMLTGIALSNLTRGSGGGGGSSDWGGGGGDSSWGGGGGFSGGGGSFGGGGASGGW